MIRGSLNNAFGVVFYFLILYKSLRTYIFNRTFMWIHACKSTLLTCWNNSMPIHFYKTFALAHEWGKFLFSGGGLRPHYTQVPALKCQNKFHPPHITFRIGASSPRPMKTLPISPTYKNPFAAFTQCQPRRMQNPPLVLLENSTLPTVLTFVAQFHKSS